MNGKIVEIIFLKDAEVKICDGRITAHVEDFPAFIRVRDGSTGEDLTQHYSMSVKKKKGKISVAIT